MSSGRPIPHAAEFARAFRTGRFCELVRANTPGPHPDFEPPQRQRELTPYEDKLAVAIANGMMIHQIVDLPFSDEEYGEYREFLRNSPRARNRNLRRPRFVKHKTEALMGIFGVNRPTTREALVRCLFTAQPPAVLPDEGLPLIPYLPDEPVTVLGLCSFGLVACTEVAPLFGVSRARALNLLRIATTPLLLSLDVDRSTAGVAGGFERGVLSLQPDPLMTPEFILSSLRHMVQLPELTLPDTNMVEAQPGLPPRVL